MEPSFKDADTSDATQFSIPRKDGGTYEFIGWIKASASSHAPSKKRWTEVYLFETLSGNIVAASVGKSTISGEVDLWTVSHYNNINDIPQFFRTTSLAEDIYRQAGIDSVNLK